MKLAAAVVLLVVILLAQEKENHITRHGRIGGDGTVHEGEGYRTALRRLRRERGPTDFGFRHRVITDNIFPSGSDTGL